MSSSSSEQAARPKPHTYVDIDGFNLYYGCLENQRYKWLDLEPELLKDIEADNPTGDIFIPKGACWLDLQEGWCRLFRGDALAGQRFASADEIERAMQIATIQLNHRARL